MQELLFFVASSFWAGAAHAATPGHGKTIAAKAHAHRLDMVTESRPTLPVLLVLAIAGGFLPDPAALALLLGALASGKVLLGLVTVVVFSLGFAATLVVVGVVAAKVGEKVLDWLSSVWMVRVQIATSLLIFGMGVVLTIRGASNVLALPS
jgi:nickel/cobalt transporter (NicO) family protein